MLRDYTISEEKPKLKEKKFNEIKIDSIKALTWEPYNPSPFKWSLEELARSIGSIDIKF